MSTSSEPVVHVETSADQMRLVLQGAFIVAHIARARALLEDIRANRQANVQRVTLDLSGIDALDTTGAWAIRDFWHAQHRQGIGVVAHGMRDDHKNLISLVECYIDQPCEFPVRRSPLAKVLHNTGEASLEIVAEGTRLLSFIGACSLRLLGTIFRPGRLRLTAMTYHLEQTGLNAIPIVCLMSLLIGVVLAFQGADQLESFGATIYTVNLLGVSILREIGILITAIIVAGRSGSAFAAQLGSMKVNEEIDALNALGLNTIDVLILPRMLALMIALPLLAIAADLSGLLGGLLICIAVLDIPVGQFLIQLKSAVSPALFFVGIGKAPIFAMLIALAGCYNGLKVSGSSESVGHYTTKAVVMAIVLVILTNAVFSILFAQIGL